LNIKNVETCRLAAELARLTGESKTGAITVALRERLERERSLHQAEVLAGDLREMGQRCARLLRAGPTAARHGELLYDDAGLPK